MSTLITTSPSSTSTNTCMTMAITTMCTPTVSAVGFGLFALICLASGLALVFVTLFMLFRVIGAGVGHDLVVQGLEAEPAGPVRADLVAREAGHVGVQALDHVHAVGDRRDHLVVFDLDAVAGVVEEGGERDPAEIARWIQTNLELATYSTEGLSGPLEDGSYVLDSGDGHCRMQTRVTPQGSLILVTVLSDVVRRRRQERQ